jgi:hypothetical protein
MVLKETVAELLALIDGAAASAAFPSTPKAGTKSRSVVEPVAAAIKSPPTPRSSPRLAAPGRADSHDDFFK